MEAMRTRSTQKPSRETPKLFFFDFRFLALRLLLRDLAFAFASLLRLYARPQPSPQRSFHRFSFYSPLLCDPQSLEFSLSLSKEIISISFSFLVGRRLRENKGINGCSDCNQCCNTTDNERPLITIDSLLHEFTLLIDGGCFDCLWRRSRLRGLSSIGISTSSPRASAAS